MCGVGSEFHSTGLIIVIPSTFEAFDLTGLDYAPEYFLEFFQNIAGLCLGSKWQSAGTKSLASVRCGLPLSISLTKPASRAWFRSALLGVEREAGKPAFALMAERGTGHYVGSAFITLNRELRVQEAGHFSSQLKSQ